MILNVVSDLHLNHYSLAGQNYITDELAKSECDYVVDAGDVGVLRDYNFLKKKLGERYIYVPGNHDRYNSSYHTSLDYNFVTVKDGIKFVCSTLFSNIKILEEYEILSNVSDFGFTRLVEFKKLHDEAYKFLCENISSDCIVVTHFVPTIKSEAEKYKNNNFIRSFFISEDCEELIYKFQPIMWIHGHTHSDFDYSIGKTRIVCNPLGYPGENPSFSHKFIRI